MFGYSGGLAIRSVSPAPVDAARVLLGTAGLLAMLIATVNKPNLLLFATALLLQAADAACGCCPDCTCGGLQVEYDAHGGVVNITDGALTHAADGTVIEDRTGPWDGGPITAGDGTVYAARISGTGPWNFSANATRPKYSADLSALVGEVPPFAFYHCRDLTDVTFGPGITSIGRAAFAGSGLSGDACKGCTPDDCKQPEQCAGCLKNPRTGASGGCVDLSVATSLTVAIDAFTYCPNLQSVLFASGVPVHPRAFHGSGLPLHAPAAVTVRDPSAPYTDWDGSLTQPQTYFAQGVPGSAERYEGPHGSADAQPLTVTSNALSAEAAVRSPQTTGRWADPWFDRSEIWYNYSAYS